MASPPNANNNLTTSCTHEGDFQTIHHAIVEIKDTLRDLKDVLLSNAVLEEQALQFKETITQLNDRINKLEIQSAQTKGTIEWIYKVIWTILSAVISGGGLVYIVAIAK